MKVKIIATIGPSSFDKSIIKKMDLLGVDYFRINLSHTKIEDFENIVKKLKFWTDKPICPDTEGSQLRTGVLKDSQCNLEQGSIIKFCSYNNKINSNSIPLNIEKLDQVLCNGDLLRIDFNSALVQVIKTQNNIIEARVIRGGKIGTNKGIGLDRLIDLPSITYKDTQIIKIAKKLKLDTFFLSFCSNENDVKSLRNLIDYPINIISKIESKDGLNNLGSICNASEGILIDRGDLSREVSLTKIAFAQSYIIDYAKKTNTPAYVATNLVESMVEQFEPNRSEINDIVNTLRNGASGLVLAAETAIGNNPVECVRVFSEIINESTSNSKISLKYLNDPISKNIIKPHGNKDLVQNIIKKQNNINRLAYIEVDEKIQSDIEQIAHGTYSPLDRFMDLEEINAVLSNNQLRDKTTWTMPIIFQQKDLNNGVLKGEKIAIKNKITENFFSVMTIDKIDKIKNMDDIAEKWFGTKDQKHPGVKSFMQNGNYILSGKPYIINKNNPKIDSSFELKPIQSRSLFSLFRWKNIIGFHTRNVPHKAHEYIQKKAIEISNADAIYISPVTGKKKSGDFLSKPIIECYNKLIKENFYTPAEAVIGTFNTYSRYSGPREAVFTAICRKNYGCNYFIIGRDHTGVGDYYKPDESLKMFDKLDLGLNILSFNTVAYNKDIKRVSEISSSNSKNNLSSISGSIIRDQLLNNNKIDNYLMRESTSKILINMLNNDPNSIFHK